MWENDSAAPHLCDSKHSALWPRVTCRPTIWHAVPPGPSWKTPLPHFFRSLLQRSRFPVPSSRQRHSVPRASPWWFSWQPPPSDISTCLFIYCLSPPVRMQELWEQKYKLYSLLYLHVLEGHLAQTSGIIHTCCVRLNGCFLSSLSFPLFLGKETPPFQGNVESYTKYLA